MRIISKLLEIPLDIEFIKRDEGNKSEEYLKLNPVGRVPTLVSVEGILTESNAICRYLCRLKPEKKLYGKDFLCAGQIDDILDFCATEFEDPSIKWAKTLAGVEPYVKDVIDNAKADVKEKMLFLEEKLKDKEYLVDNSLSMADICMFCMLVKPYTLCFYPEYRVSFTHVTEWFSRINNIPEVESVVGKIKLCEKEVEFH